MSMACMDSRISFSNDFADTQNQESNYREAPVSAEFEFSVRNNTMIPADEIFFKGMLVPLKENCGNQMRKMTTLREELLAGDDEGALPRMPKSSGGWRERLGLKRGHTVSKKGNGVLVMEAIVEEKKYEFINEEGPVGNTIQPMWDIFLNIPPHVQAGLLPNPYHVGTFDRRRVKLKRIWSMKPAPIVSKSKQDLKRRHWQF